MVVGSYLPTAQCDAVVMNIKPPVNSCDAVTAGRTILNRGHDIAVCSYKLPVIISLIKLAVVIL